MAQKKICDVCGKDITDLGESDLAPTRAYVKIGVLGYPSSTISIHIGDEFDFCEKCRMEVEIDAANALLERLRKMLALRKEG